MSKVIIVTILLFSAMWGSAQSDRDYGWMMGVSAGVADYNGNKDHQTGSYYHIRPELGYFIAKNLALGVNLNFSSFSFENSPYTQIGVGLFSRIMVKNIFLQGSLDTGFSVWDEVYGYSKINAYVGYSIFVCETFAIEPQLFFSSYNEKGESYDFEGFGLGVGFQFFPFRE